MTYEIKIPQFEGPFDLLLYFIERDELDIYDIPISKITNDFLAYIHRLEKLNFEVASEFILVAATLMRIKARMLLPRKELDDEGNEIDPRQELVEKIIEYKRYKAILNELRKMESERLQQHLRPATREELKKIYESIAGESELQSISLYKLLNAFRKVLKRFEDSQRKISHHVDQYAYTIQGQKDFVMKRLKENMMMDFEKLFRKCESRIHAIFIFLAILELLQQQTINIFIGQGINNFKIQINE